MSLKLKGTLIQPSEVINGGILKPGPTNARFDELLVANHIKDAEERWIEPVLCKDFYKALIELKGEVCSNYNPKCGDIVEAFPSDEKLECLWRERLMRVVSYAVILEAKPFIGVQSGANGWFMNNSEFADNVGIEGIKYIGGRLEDRLRFQLKKLREELCDNIECYPLFEECYCVKCKCEKKGCSCKKCDEESSSGFLGVVIY